MMQLSVPVEEDQLKWISFNKIFEKKTEDYGSKIKLVSVTNH